MQGLMKTNCIHYSFKAQVVPSQVTFCVRIYIIMQLYVGVNSYTCMHTPTGSLHVYTVINFSANYIYFRA